MHVDPHPYFERLAQQGQPYPVSYRITKSITGSCADCDQPLDAGAHEWSDGTQRCGTCNRPLLRAALGLAV